MAHGSIPYGKNNDRFLDAPGEVAKYLREHDWKNSPLGPTDQWPQSLRTIVGLVLSSRFPMYVAWGPERIFIYNEAYLPLIGTLKHPKALGRPFADVWPEIYSELLPMMKSIDAGESVYLEDYPLVLERKGFPEETYFTFSFSAIRDDDEKINGILCSCYETTERVIAAKRALVSKATFERNVDVSPAMLWITEKDGSCSYLSKQWYEFTGQTEDEALGFGWLKAVHPEDSDHAGKAFNHSNDTKTPFYIEYRLRHKNGQYRWAIDAGNPRYDSKGEYLGISGSVIDIHDRVTVAEELRRSQAAALAAQAEAERANELKSAFLANMSHEIRTPLGAMMGFADLLRDPGLTAEERSSYIDILFRNGEGLSVIINDILDLSKVEAGHLNLEFTDTYPHEIAADVISLLRVKAREKDLVLECEVDPATPKSVVSDPMRVRQILLNLIGNAIKFTPMGKVRLNIYGCKTDDGRDAMCFEICDTGIGIPPDQISRIFEMFVQGDGTMTRRFGGTGLGLALSRRLARALGGDVTILKSKLGSGTTFLVKVEDQPHRRSVEQTRMDEKRKTFEITEQSLPGIKILVVDDSPDNRQLIWHYLTKQGAIVETAENGLLGYRAALTHDYDIVLMDIQMPIMDGYSAAAKLRENGYKKPLIALTAHAMSEVRRKALAVGFTDHLPKPINPVDLISRIVEYTIQPSAET